MIRSFFRNDFTRRLLTSFGATAAVCALLGHLGLLSAFG